MPSFIATLGMLEMARGATYLVTRSQTQYLGARVEGIAAASLLGLSAPFLAALCLVFAAEFVLTRTVFGRYMVAIGTNEEALRLAGVDPRPVKLAVFILSGLLAALAGVVYASRLASADPNAGVGFELSAIAAVVVGGTSLMGGRGSVVGSLLGVAIIAVLGSGLAQAGAQEPTKRLVTGAVIIAAVLADHYRRARHEASTVSGRILVVGSLNADLVVRVERFPAPGETVPGRDFAVFPGGKGGNQACAAARLGGRVEMIGGVGDDAYGALRHRDAPVRGSRRDGHSAARGAHGSRPHHRGRRRPERDRRRGGRERAA